MALDYSLFFYGAYKMQLFKQRMIICDLLEVKEQMDKRGMIHLSALLQRDINKQRETIRTYYDTTLRF